MKTLLCILAVCALVGCERPKPTVNQARYLELPSCMFISVGGCSYLWCESGFHPDTMRTGMAPVDAMCKPTSAVVTYLK